MLVPFEDVEIESQKEKKLLANTVQNIPSYLVVPWLESKMNGEKREGTPDYLFYSACYFARKGEIPKAQKLLKKAFHSGFDNKEKYEEEKKDGTFEKLEQKVLIELECYFK